MNIIQQAISSMSIAEAIANYLNATTFNSQLEAKKEFISVINERSLQTNPTATRAEVWQVLRRLNDMPDWLTGRFTPGSIYREGSRVYGWLKDASIQVQAEQLPFSRNSIFLVVDFNGWSKEEELIWRELGFIPAEDLPAKLYRDCIEVNFPIERSLFWIEYGYALPCKLQHYRHQNALYIDRDIIEHGFQRAWAWSKNVRWAHLQSHPEWFADLEWWDKVEPTRYEPDNPHAAVLGGKCDRSQLIKNVREIS